MGVKISRATCLLAEENGCIILCTDYDAYASAQIISQTAPVRYFMIADGLLTFTLDSVVEDAMKVMASVRHHYFPVLDNDGSYMGASPAGT